MTRSVSRPVVCGIAVERTELVEHHRVRRAVFVAEQGVFVDSDLDAHDARDDVLHVVARIGGDVVGTVRLFPLDTATRLWQGDRLAVLPEWRSAGAGAPLVRFAVAAATARGGRRMLAHVQPGNRRFFAHLGWTAGAREEYAGRPHILMAIDLRGAASGSAHRLGDDEASARGEAGPQLRR